MNNQQSIQAPELQVNEWLNTTKPLNLADLRGNVVVLHAFQMLCPGCVLHGLPQAAAIHELYKNDSVQVIGLHSVFEHHDVMTVPALNAFASEYNLEFPIAVDKPSDNSAIPKTMAAYHLRGTPSLVVIDQQGHIRLNHFGRMSDMQAGDVIGRLLSENPGKKHPVSSGKTSEKCDADGCPV